MSFISTNKEDAERVKALHQWLTSQDIPEHQWAPLLMKAVSYEVWKASNGDISKTLIGQLLVTEMLVEWSGRDMLNV